jgi:hypothetical protein
MLFVTIGKAKAGTTKERVARRMQWSYPEGMHVIAEYWLQNCEAELVVAAEADSIAPIMAATSAWDDVFNFTVTPAVTAEQGLEIAKHMG